MLPLPRLVRPAFAARGPLPRGGRRRPRSTPATRRARRTATTGVQNRLPRMGVIGGGRMSFSAPPGGEKGAGGGDSERRCAGGAGVGSGSLLGCRLRGAVHPVLAGLAMLPPSPHEGVRAVCPARDEPAEAAVSLRGAERRERPASPVGAFVPGDRARAPGRSSDRVLPSWRGCVAEACSSTGFRPKSSRNSQQWHRGFVA
jgi:hypothetical protein